MLRLHGFVRVTARRRKAKTVDCVDAATDLNWLLHKQRLVETVVTVAAAATDAAMYERKPA